MKENHLSYDQKKQKLIESLQKYNSEKHGPISIYKNRSNLFRAQEKSGKRLDVRNFDQVIDIDEVNLTAEVEGMTPYENLVKEALRHGCLPTIVPELKSITIGGALSGCGIESSSFRYGLVHETILETEVLLSNGQVITCSPTNEHARLFFAFPNSYGTLGYALKVKVRLIPAKKFIRLSHQRFSDPDLFFETLNTLCRENRDQGLISYIDGVIFERDEMYITTGEAVDQAPYLSDYKFLNIYYRSIRSRKEDYLPTEDYIWRWDTDWFWCSKVFCMQNFLARLMLGKFMLTSKAYTKIMNYVQRHPALNSFLGMFQARQESIIQDVLIPVHKASQFLEFFQKEIGIKPIWICPASSYSKNAKYSLCPLDPEVLYIDFGFWDGVPSNKTIGFYNRKIEKEVQDLQGFKSLYSSSYYSEDEFWQLYNKEEYTDLKNTYDPQGLLGNLYQKCVDAKRN